MIIEEEEEVDFQLRKSKSEIMILKATISHLSSLGRSLVIFIVELMNIEAKNIKVYNLLADKIIIHY